ncbi:MAG: hypothetical protein AAFZ07_29160 [Actinomycetota bacterium]
MRRLLLAAALLLVLAGCRAELTVDVAVEADGSGTVTVTLDVDADAVAEVPELAGGLRADDLTAAGWTLERPQVDSGARLVATKPFGSPEALAAVLAEIDGPDGVIAGSSLVVEQGVDQRRYVASVQVDPDRELVDLSDDEVAALLDGAPLGREASELGDADLSLVVRLTVPGADPVERRFAAGDPPAELAVEGIVVDDEALALRDDAADQRDLARTVMLALGVAWVLVLLWWWWGRRRARRRVPAPVPAEPAPEVPEPATTPVAVGEAGTSRPAEPRPEPELDEIEVDTGEWRPG